MAAVLDAIQRTESTMAEGEIDDMSFLRPTWGHSPLSEPQSGRWHPAALSVVADVCALAMRNVNRFHLSRQRTGRLKDGVVGFGWEGARSVQGWLVTDKVHTGAINRDAQAMQRKCRRLI